MEPTAGHFGPNWGPQGDTHGKRRNGGDILGGGQGILPVDIGVAWARPHRQVVASAPPPPASTNGAVIDTLAAPRTGFTNCATPAGAATAHDGAGAATQATWTAAATIAAANTVASRDRPAQRHVTYLHLERGGRVGPLPQWEEKARDRR